MGLMGANVEGGSDETVKTEVESTNEDGDAEAKTVEVIQ